MKIAIIDHPYHKKTKSTDFLHKLLEELGDVSLYWEESWWNGNGPMDVKPVLEGGYDMIVCLQTEFLAPILLRHHSNIVLIPMFDGANSWDETFWRQCSRARIISFCRTLHERVIGYGCDSYYFKYAPDPTKFKVQGDFSELKGFFWERVPQSKINSNFVCKILSKSSLKHLHIHQAPDVGEKTNFSNKHPFSISDSVWFENYSEFLELVASSNIFIQPRIREGIGMAFLEAMAMGQCVVSPDYPTMNEYILHGINGVSYSVDSPPDFTFLTSDVAKKMGQEARKTIEYTYAEWVTSKPRFLDLLSRPKSKAYFREHFNYLKAQKKTAIIHVKPKSKRKENPPTVSGRITIATVVYNARDDILRTIESVQALKYSDIEYIIIDGGSNDGTLDLIGTHADDIDYWRSEPDEGAFDAMNKAVRYATGEYILFLNAGDILLNDDVLDRVMESVKNDELRHDFIFGHHFWKKQNGTFERKLARPFDETWDRLQAGSVDISWLIGMPCHQSTLTKTMFLRDNLLDVSYHFAADHDLLFRAKRDGASLKNCNIEISIYEEGGLTSQNMERLNVEWYDIAKSYAPDNPSVDRLYSRATGYQSLGYLGRNTKSQIITSPVSTALYGTEKYKHKIAQKLKNYPLLFDIARKSYKVLTMKVK